MIQAPCVDEEPVCSFEEMYVATFRRLTYYLRWLDCDEATAEDVAQDTYIKAMLLPDFQPSSGRRAMGWLRRAAKFQLLNHGRKVKQGKIQYVGLLPHQETVPGAAPKPPEPIEPTGPLAEAIGHQIAKLAPEDRQVIERRYLDGLDYSDLKPGATTRWARQRVKAIRAGLKSACELAAAEAGIKWTPVKTRIKRERPSIDPLPRPQRIPLLAIAELFGNWHEQDLTEEEANASLAVLRREPPSMIAKIRRQAEAEGLTER